MYSSSSLSSSSVIKGYVILSASSIDMNKCAEKISESINALIKKGWQLNGNCIE